MRADLSNEKKKKSGGQTLPDLHKQGLQRDYNDASNMYAREARQIMYGLSKLIKEVSLIEQNKFSEQIKASQQAEDPTEELFDEEIQESIQNETGMHVINWGPIKKNINFISAKPALVQDTSGQASLKAEYPENSDLSE